MQGTILRYDCKDEHLLAINHKAEVVLGIVSLLFTMVDDLPIAPLLPLRNFLLIAGEKQILTGAEYRY